MFDSLGDRLQGIAKRLRGKGRLTEADVDEVLAEIRTALLEADVNVGVVRDVVARRDQEARGVAIEAMHDGRATVFFAMGGNFATALLVGVVIAYVYRGQGPHWLDEHYRYLIRTDAAGPRITTVIAAHKAQGAQRVGETVGEGAQLAELDDAYLARIVVE